MIVKPLAAAVRMTCSPKLNIVAAVGVTVRLSAEAVIVSVPPPAQGPAFAELAAARPQMAMVEDKKKRGSITVPRFSTMFASRGRDKSRVSGQRTGTRAP